MSHAVVGLFDEALEHQVRSFWATIAERFAMDGIQAVPFPHVSFLVFGEHDPALTDQLQSVASQLQPIPVESDGWTLYTGPAPVYPALVRQVRPSTAARLARRVVAEACTGSIPGTVRLGDPDSWSPHITCSSRGRAEQDLGTLFTWLVDEPIPPWQGHITRLGLIVNPAGTMHELAVDLPLGT